MPTTERHKVTGGWCNRWLSPFCLGPSFDATYYVGGGEPALCQVCEARRLANILLSASVETPRVEHVGAS